MTDLIVEAVRADLLKRSERGLVKYGTGVDRSALPLSAWLQHAYEEALDMAIYLKRAMQESPEQTIRSLLPKEEGK